VLLLLLLLLFACPQTRIVQQLQLCMSPQLLQLQRKHFMHCGVLR
jgi:hypothetical protein